MWDSGEWWMLLAAQSMAVGTVMVRWVAKYCDPVVATGWHMVLGGLPLLALALVQEGPEALERLPLLTGPVRLDVRVYVPDARRWAWDNAGKVVSDALNGIAYVDDSQIRDGRVRSYPAGDGGPMVIVEITDVSSHVEPLGKAKPDRAKKPDGLPDMRASKRKGQP